MFEYFTALLFIMTHTKFVLKYWMPFMFLHFITLVLCSISFHCRCY